MHTATRIAELDIRYLENGAAANPDGHGWAIATAGQVMTHRTMDAIEAIETWADVAERWPTAAGIFHSRLATHGTMDTMNVHPFVIMPGAILAHNGIIPEAHVRPIGDMSDTRTLAEVVLPAMARKPGELHSRRIRKYLRRIANGSRFAILTADGRMSHVNRQHGIELGDGLWASNTGGLHAPRWAYTSPFGPIEADTDEPDDADDTWTCSDCDATWSDCECWIPSHR